jgi:hypothetical protein
MARRPRLGPSRAPAGAEAAFARAASTRAPSLRRRPRSSSPARIPAAESLAQLLGAAGQLEPLEEGSLGRLEEEGRALAVDSRDPASGTSIEVEEGSRYQGFGSRDEPRPGAGAGFLADPAPPREKRHA